MNFLRSRHAKVRAAIATLDVSHFIKKAKELFSLDEAEVAQAEKEYRHFLWLLWWNRKEGNSLPVVPTERADKIWHAHLLFNGSYNLFCRNVYGEIIEHKPGLEVGSERFVYAVLHTRALHLQVGYDGFDPDYFAYVDDMYRSSGSQKDTKKKEDGAAGGGCGGGATTPAAGSSCGSSCGGGCGGGCGG